LAWVPFQQGQIPLNRSLVNDQDLLCPEIELVFKKQMNKKKREKPPMTEKKWYNLCQICRRVDKGDGHQGCRKGCEGN